MLADAANQWSVLSAFIVAAGALSVALVQRSRSKTARKAINYEAGNLTQIALLNAQVVRRQQQLVERAEKRAASAEQRAAAAEEHAERCDEMLSKHGLTA